MKLGTLFAVLNYGFDIFLNGQRSSVINCYVVALADENKNIVFRKIYELIQCTTNDQSSICSNIFGIG